jgi:hypothetical protein
VPQLTAGASAAGIRNRGCLKFTLRFDPVGPRNLPAALTRGGFFLPDLKWKGPSRRTNNRGPRCSRASWVRGLEGALRSPMDRRRRSGSPSAAASGFPA